MVLVSRFLLWYGCVVAVSGRLDCHQELCLVGIG